MLAHSVQSAVTSKPTVTRRSAVAPFTSEDVAVLTLDDHGVVCDCNHGGEVLFKYPRDELVLQHVSLLLPDLAELPPMQNGQINLRMRYLSRIGHHFHGVTRDGSSFASELFLNLLGNKEGIRLTLIVRPVT